ncbi:MAG: hemolysin family protein [Pleurocapsa minor GSE-CHR-MK-17-07R]|jgi:putative hemolysin|nr:hemolysin family protein [Pleurocapsa minor GSE-CHR-MK 17-07R]
MEILIELAIIFVLVLANGFFSASELAVMSSRRSRLEEQANEHRQGAAKALTLLDKPDNFLASVQVGITLIGTLSSAFGGARLGSILEGWLRTIPVLAPLAEGLALGFVVLFITYISLVFGELTPKQITLRDREGVARFTAPIMVAMSAFAKPVIGLLNLSVAGVMRLLGLKALPPDQVTQEDIEYLIRQGTASGVVQQGEAQVIQRLFELSDRPVRAVMTPRTEVAAIDVRMSVPEIAAAFHQHKFSRMPVYEKSIDTIIGTLHARDVIDLLLAQPTPTDVRSRLFPPIYIPETAEIQDAITQMQQQHIHLAIVIDEYGQTAGVVTFEDALEELIGDIRDEHDVGETPDIVQRADGSWLVDAIIPFDRVHEELGIPYPDPDEINHGEFTTLAGLVMALLNRIPTAGDIAEVEGFTIEVLDMDGRRVDKVQVTKVKKEDSDEG